MREYINLVEKMVHLDSRHMDGYDVALNPSREEWQRYFSKNGAAGVLMQDGVTIVVGDGSCLDHESLMKMASLDPQNELFRLQIYDNKAHIEMWDHKIEAWSDGGGDDSTLTPELIEEIAQFKKADRMEAARLVKRAVTKFMGDVPVIVELKTGTNPEGYLEEVY